MVESGAIQRQSYSLYLNDLESGLGDIVFGGVDTGKYDGECVVVPFAEEPDGGFREFLVNLTAITFDGGSNGPVSLLRDTAQVPSLLDSGTTLIEVPQDLFDVLQKAFAIDENNLVACDIRAQSELAIAWSFGGSDGPTIKTSIADIIAPPDGTTDSAGNNICFFGIRAQSDNFPPIILGDAFLRFRSTSSLRS